MIASDLPEEERQRVEVWTRVMGYHRPVSSFNVGKRGEHAERRYFREPAQKTSTRSQVIDSAHI